MLFELHAHKSTQKEIVFGLLSPEREVSSKFFTHDSKASLMRKKREGCFSDWAAKHLPSDAVV